jgi:tetratricopeptide (TPR) repeat protein
LSYILSGNFLFSYQPNRPLLDERRRGYQQTGMLLPGIKFFQQQLERYPDDDNVYYHLGLLMYDLAMKETKNDIKLKNEQDYWNKAEELFKKCLSLNPEHRSAPYNLGLVFAQKNDWENALKYFEQAVQRNPQKPDMQFALAWAYEKLGNMDKALDNYRQVLTKDPNHVRALTHSGAILYRLGKISEAKRYIEKAVEIDPNYPDAQFILDSSITVRNPSTA